MAYNRCVNYRWNDDLFLDYWLDGFMDVMMNMLALDGCGFFVGDDSLCFRLQVLELLLFLCQQSFQQSGIAMFVFMVLDIVHNVFMLLRKDLDLFDREY